MIQTTWEIVNRPGLLIAVETKQKKGGSVMVVWRSPQVRQTNKIYQPISDRLKESCYWQCESQTIPFPGVMVLGEAWVSSYELYEGCPGEGVSHECAQLLVGMCGPRMVAMDRDGIRSSVHEYQVAQP